MIKQPSVVGTPNSSPLATPWFTFSRFCRAIGDGLRQHSPIPDTMATDSVSFPGRTTTTGPHEFGAIGPTSRMPQRNFLKRKSALLHEAVELSTHFGCDVGLVFFDAAGCLMQYSSTAMATILKRYSEACTHPHEIYTNEKVDKLHDGMDFEDLMLNAPVCYQLHWKLGCSCSLANGTNCIDIRGGRGALHGSLLPMDLSRGILHPAGRVV